MNKQEVNDLLDHHDNLKEILHEINMQLTMIQSLTKSVTGMGGSFKEHTDNWEKSIDRCTEKVASLSVDYRTYLNGLR